MDMKEQTGIATLKLDEEGKRYWSICTEDAKDAFAFDPGQCLEMHPDAFEEGTEIQTFEEEA